MRETSHLTFDDAVTAWLPGPASASSATSRAVLEHLRGRRVKNSTARLHRGQPPGPATSLPRRADSDECLKNDGKLTPWAYASSKVHWDLPSAWPNDTVVIRGQNRH